MNIPLSTDDKLEIIYQFCLWHMRDDLRDMNNWEDSRLPNDEAAD